MTTTVAAGRSPIRPGGTPFSAGRARLGSRGGPRRDVSSLIRLRPFATRFLRYSAVRSRWRVSRSLLPWASNCRFWKQAPIDDWWSRIGVDLHERVTRSALRPRTRCGGLRLQATSRLKTELMHRESLEMMDRPSRTSQAGGCNDSDEAGRVLDR